MTFLKGFFKKLKHSEEVKKNTLPDGIIRNVDPNSIWKIESELGDGAYGKVFKVKKIDGSLQAALKTIKFESEDELEDFVVEFEILTSTKHPNVLSMHEAYLFNSSLWFFLEFCSGGALDSIMNTLEKPLSEPQIRYVAHEMLEGLSFLHARRIIHRDLKAGNVLITASAEIRLADFGASAKLVDEKQKRDTFIGTPYWMAPEVINCESAKATPYNYRADIWSFGITLIELAQMRPPNDTTNPTRVLFRIVQSDPPTLRIPFQWSKEFNQIIARCLQKDPAQRPESKELLYDPFVKDVCEDDRRYIRLLLGELKADVEDSVEDIPIDSPEIPDDALAMPLDDLLSDEEDEGLVTDASGEDGLGAAGLPDQPVESHPPVAPPSFPVDEVALAAALQDITEELVEKVITSETRHASIPSCVFEVMHDLSQAAGVHTTGSTTSSLTKGDSISMATVKSCEEEESAELNATGGKVVAPAAADGASPHSPKPSTPGQTQSPLDTATSGKKLGRKNTLYKSVTRTRRFVVDGKEVVTKTHHVVPTHSDPRHRTVDDFQKRKAELRAVRLIGKQEAGQIRELTNRAGQLTDQLESKLSAEVMTIRRNYEQKLESASRHCRTNIEKLEKEQEADIKRIRADSAKREQAFKENLKAEINSYPYREERKAALRELRAWSQSTPLSGLPTFSSGSSTVSVHSSSSASSAHCNTSVVFAVNKRLAQFKEEESQRLQDSLQQASSFFSTQCAKLLQGELVEKQAIRTDFEREKWQLEKGHMQARYQLDRTRMQDFFLIKRQKLTRMLQLDLMELRQTTIGERESLTLRHVLARKKFTKDAKAINKRVLADFCRSARSTVVASQFKEQSLELEKTTREKVNMERMRLEERLLTEAQALEQSILVRGSELEQSHARRRNELIDCERERLQELDQRLADEVRAHNKVLPHTLKILNVQFAQELHDLSRSLDSHGHPRKTQLSLFSIFPSLTNMANGSSCP